MPTQNKFVLHYVSVVNHIIVSYPTLVFQQMQKEEKQKSGRQKIPLLLHYIYG